MNMLWTLLVTKKTSEYYHEKPMENYQSRITAQKDPSEKWLVSWGGFVDFLFQPLPLILQLHTLENEHIFWSQNWDLDGRCCCGLFFFNLGGDFFSSFAVSFWRSFFFERKNFVRRFRWNLPGGERTGLRLALWPYRRMFSICLTLEPFDDRCFGDRLAGGWENDTWRHLVYKSYTPY